MLGNSIDKKKELMMEEKNYYPTQTQSRNKRVEKSMTELFCGWVVISFVVCVVWSAVVIACLLGIHGNEAFHGPRLEHVFWHYIAPISIIIVLFVGGIMFAYEQHEKSMDSTRR